MYFANLRRHLVDLKERHYHGAVSRAEKDEEFVRSVALLDPVVRAVLDEMNRVFLLGSGEVQGSGVRDEPGGVSAARWTLSWPEQRRTPPVATPNEPLPPVEVTAIFPSHMHHPHLRGTAGGHWPFNVESAAEAEQMRPTIEAIATAALHQLVFDAGGLNAGWRLIPLMTSEQVGERTASS
jgi:hypothetical protein